MLERKKGKNVVGVVMMMKHLQLMRNESVPLETLDGRWSWCASWRKQEELLSHGLCCQYEQVKALNNLVHQHNMDDWSDWNALNGSRGNKSDFLPPR